MPIRPRNTLHPRTQPPTAATARPWRCAIFDGHFCEILGGRQRPVNRLGDVGSIPAHAGEPRSGRSSTRLAEVYPRPRGGALFSYNSEFAVNGLSPPTRGSRKEKDGGGDMDRSIPAHAGEPRKIGRHETVRRVYPRPRGGAGLPVRDRFRLRGLSPPTRGSLRFEFAHSVLYGSIPAHAGEPSSVIRLATAHRVYPRPRGGAPQ